MASAEERLTLLSPTTLAYNGNVYQCQTGRGGIRTKKVEGDGATPTGLFPLRQVFYRPDRVRPFACSLPVISLSPEDGWCNDPTDRAYNQPIKLPYRASHEELWRDSPAYDFIVVVGYNDDPVVAAKGSAIFIHLLNEKATPTAGCIALSRRDMVGLLADITPQTRLLVPDHLNAPVVSA